MFLDIIIEQATNVFEPMGEKIQSIGIEQVEKIESIAVGKINSILDSKIDKM